ncbi:MAG: DUF167 domain-containing protein [Candidatus Methanomethylophilaceae archaeon]|jgi:uncharacterized protein|nr:DUF167 domain-containing protein [Candidatus Methanomethylophilaceae archaeon]MDD2936488.1 DUF167 domain-containing protein [Candidatus Methanomethylophilaceae archaeon]MDD3351661.1 DUF167 domain-containing protein [Candidatus Methanomethylophilaceae archaeon]MDD3986861.1 DUF167 domain-containing protein [Candidatus Methanomethylophilaceae archaeon]MDD4708936.1 DUF167 domain-containing protein [Candidatus Methanomethylophilaceae archaeon]
MQLSDVSRKTAVGLEVSLYVSPRSSVSGIDGFDLWRKRLIVRVRSPPLDGRANREVEEIIGGITGMKTVVKSGAADRRKTVLVEGDADAAAERLGDAL